MKYASLLVLVIISGCHERTYDTRAPDISGVYESTGCPDISIDAHYIHLPQGTYEYNLINIKGINYINLDGSIVYDLINGQCRVIRDGRQRYLKLLPSEKKFIIEMFSASLDHSIYYQKVGNAASLGITAR